MPICLWLALIRKKPLALTMPKKKSGLLQFLWRATMFLSTSFLHLIYLLAKFLFHSGQFLFQHISAAVKTRSTNERKLRTITSFSPLVLQKRLSGSLEQFEGKLLNSKSSIGIILGARGSGKSALGMRLLENIAAKTGRAVCAIGFDPQTLPDWIKCVQTVEEVPNGSFVLVDEGGITFSSRSSFSSANKLLSSLLLVSRHKDLSILFISQNSANLEVNTIRQADYLLMRKPSLLQREFERKRIGKIYADIGAHFASLPDGGRYSTYIYSDEFLGFAANPLPSFWSSRASKSFSSFHLTQEKA
jgi:hypothetical protein